MESDLQSNLDSQLMPEQAKPEMLRILCILSFVGCGLVIIMYSFLSLLLALDPATIDGFWPQIVESNPQFADVDAVTFIASLGMVGVYGLIANVFSLIGVIMMWRLEKIGFFVYAIAELSTNFLSMDIPGAEKSSGGAIFGIVIDLVFIALYFVNLKHMNKKNNNSYVQTGG